MIDEGIINTVIILVSILIFIFIVLAGKKPSEHAKRKETEEIKKDIERVRDVVHESAKNLGNIEHAVKKEEDITRNVETQAEKIREKIRRLERYKRILKNNTGFNIGGEIKEKCKEIIKNVEDIIEILEEPIKISKRILNNLKQKKYDLEKATRILTEEEKKAEFMNIETRREKREIHEEEYYDRKLLEDIQNLISKTQKTINELQTAQKQCQELVGIASKILLEIDHADKHNEVANRDIRKMFDNLHKMSRLIDKIIVAFNDALENEEKAEKYTKISEKDAKQENRLAA
jgi:chromosome segregation ATPase